LASLPARPLQRSATTSPVGHFTSAAAQDRFLAAYDKAMHILPPPDQTLDLRTDYGIVRVYRFNGSASTSQVPIVLLPGPRLRFTNLG
jgi:hypothetical protein